ncbi:SGNH/GDSL hydrolase family protein [Amycolatopsis sp. YIM 10]|uniref:SGNH/GDSL hydrolase family protein n=1 Tax=Amycolatopsis sp. YIM 10 TaxID=2653857 RepID=UPI001290303D|nr:SGNH/GDSL hydrolase family protein [Amycolatopsis sp. YIM 10]QFU90810.1 GDSL-like Lipase/Acylhydrolase [Amycolatopsis sp. YIM 10]
MPAARASSRRSRIRRGTVFAATGLLLLTAAPGASTAPEGRAGPAWTGSWTTGVTVASAGTGQTGFTDTTIRQVVHLSVGGSELRLRLSNVFGTSPLRIGAATVAVQHAEGGSRVDEDTLRQVRFGGERMTTIPIGAEWVSDPIDLTVADGANLTVSLHLPGPTGPLTQHRAAFATNWTTPGNETAAEGTGFTPLGTSWYLLDGVDARTVSAGSAVFFGDSITDGANTTVDRNYRYPDRVAARVLAKPERAEYGVLNTGIGGARLLTDQGPAGQSAMARFDRDVSGQSGVRAVVLLLGINDIGGTRGAVAAEDLISVHRQFIARAKSLGLKVYGATLLPFEGAGYYTPEGEADRQALNKFIRTSGEYDGVIDFDRATGDPAQPTRLNPAYDAGDHLHPNDAGMEAMAAVVPVDRLVR